MLEVNDARTLNISTEAITERFTNQTMRLAYLLPEVLERLVVNQEPPNISLAELIDATYLLARHVGFTCEELRPCVAPRPRVIALSDGCSAMTSSVAMQRKCSIYGMICESSDYKK